MKRISLIAAAALLVAGTKAHAQAAKKDTTHAKAPAGAMAPKTATAAARPAATSAEKPAAEKPAAEKPAHKTAKSKAKKADTAAPKKP